MLGSHEGEGLALAAGGLGGLAGSRSPYLASRGQAVDMVRGREGARVY